MLLMMKHAMTQKKNTTPKTWNVTLGPTFTAEGRSGPNLTTSLNDRIGKGGKSGNKS
jgi:hypothetical protein